MIEACAAIHRVGDKVFDVRDDAYSNLPEFCPEGKVALYTFRARRSTR